MLGLLLYVLSVYTVVYSEMTTQLCLHLLQQNNKTRLPPSLSLSLLYRKGGENPLKIRPEKEVLIQIQTATLTLPLATPCPIVRGSCQHHCTCSSYPLARITRVCVCVWGGDRLGEHEAKRF